MFFKNQEVPQVFYDMDSNTYADKPSNKAVWDDYTDFSMTIVDNGDEKVSVIVDLNDGK